MEGLLYNFIYHLQKNKHLNPPPETVQNALTGQVTFGFLLGVSFCVFVVEVVVEVEGASSPRFGVLDPAFSAVKYGELNTEI